MAVGGVMALRWRSRPWLYPALGGRTYGIGVASAALGLGFASGSPAWRGEGICGLRRRPAGI